MARTPMLSLVLDSDTDTVTLPVYMRSVLQWEKRFSGRSVSQLQEDRVRLTYLYELAFIVAVDNGVFSGKYDEFTDTYDVSALDDEDESPDPTQVDHSTEPSLNSPVVPESLSPIGAMS